MTTKTRTHAAWRHRRDRRSLAQRRRASPFRRTLMQRLRHWLATVLRHL